MKKLIALTLLLCTLTLMFTSCDAVDTVRNFVNSVFGITRSTVTEEEWNNAFDITNYTAVTLTGDTKMIIYTDYPYVKYEIIDMDNPDDVQEMYINLQTGDLCSMENGEWKEINENGFIVDKERVSLKTDIKADEIDFEDLVYDKETKSYTYNQRMEADYVFKFENGTLVSIEMIMKAGADAKQFVFDFGTTVVEWPTK